VKYPIAIEPGDDTHAFGVVVPDLPGCFSAGDTLEEAIDNSKEAIVLWMETVVEDGLPVPEPSSMARLTADPEFSGWLWAVVEIDAAILDSKSERVNISVPRRVLAMIDRYVLNHGGTRSGFLANAALDKIMHVSA
jgi:predicted RNase H-like HicB family nuclease